jgi:hypothetical protein
MWALSRGGVTDVTAKRDILGESGNGNVRFDRSASLSGAARRTGSLCPQGRAWAKGQAWK